LCNTLRGVVALLIFGMSVAMTPAEEAWQVLRDCRIIPNAANDGDSFHVSHGEDHFIFRLCFVDAPETSLAIRARVQEQAKWWNISEEDVLRYGAEASVLSMDFLKDGFTVFTQHKDARGRSALPRYFAMVQVDGKFLSAALAKAGLGRAYGYLPTLPDGTSRWAYRARIQALEAAAKAGRRGAWGGEAAVSP